MSARHGFAHIILIAVLAATLAIFGLVYFKSLQTTPYTNPNPTQTSTSTATQSATKKPDKTTNWKTYTNEKYKYSIKYPADWVVALNGGNWPDYSNVPTEKLPSVIFWNGPSGKNVGGLNNLVISADPSNKTAIIQTEKSNRSDNSDTTIIKLDGKEAATYIANCCTGGSTKFLTTNNKDNIGILLSFGFLPKDQEQAMKTIDQILSTFKFLN